MKKLIAGLMCMIMVSQVAFAWEKDVITRGKLEGGGYATLDHPKTEYTAENAGEGLERIGVGGLIGAIMFGGWAVCSFIGYLGYSIYEGSFTDGKAGKWGLYTLTLLLPTALSALLSFIGFEYGTPLPH